MFICVNTSIDYPTKQFIHDICQALCTIEMKTVVSKVFYKNVLITHTRGFQPFDAVQYLSQATKMCGKYKERVCKETPCRMKDYH